MQYRSLGKLDVEVSVVGMGAAAISGEGGGYGFGHISEDASIALVHAAQDSGINLFDTAPIYGFGMSEKRQVVLRIWSELQVAKWPSVI